MRIVITDSGLGGLSVCSEIEVLSRTEKSIDELELIYFNSLPDNGHGYNNMEDDYEKANVFNSALNSMESKFHPDKILIACNTLSVVADKTEFIKKYSAKVIGIVDFGVNMVLSKIRKHPNSLVLVLGTPTTINSLTYQKRLIGKGIPQNNILGQSCYLLETEIQKSPFSKSVEELIVKYLNEAKAKITSYYENIIVLLACTHYGYSLKLFDEILRRTFNKPVIICNPNDSMAKFIFNDNDNKYDSPKISVELYTQADITKEEKQNIGKLIKEKSPATFSSLINCSATKNLFSYKNYNENN